MFDSITIKINNPSNPLDIGYLAECLLFYDKTNLLIDKDSLIVLFKTCGVDEIKTLIERGNLSILTKGNIIGSGQKGNDFFVDLFTAQNVDKHYEIFYDAFFSLYGKQGKSRRNAKRFVDLTHSYKYDSQVLVAIRESINDKAFVRQIINSFYKDIGIDKEFIGKEWSYDFVAIDDYSFRHVTSLDIENLKIVANEHNLHFDFSPSSLLLDLSESLGDIQIAINNNSEIFTTPISSKIINLKFENVFEKAHINREAIDKFQKIALPNYKNLSLVINEGQKSFNDLIKLLDKADRFKSWKSELKSESDFIEEYSKALEKDSWFDKLPFKIGRFSIFEGIGLLTDLLGGGGVGTAATTMMSAGDAFLLDKLLKKWKPNQFIKGEYKKFVK